MMKRTIETLLNELFSLNKKDNEKAIEQYRQEGDITINYIIHMPGTTTIFYLLLLALDR